MFVSIIDWFLSWFGLESIPIVEFSELLEKKDKLEVFEARFQEKVDELQKKFTEKESECEKNYKEKEKKFKEELVALDKKYFDVPDDKFTLEQAFDYAEKYSVAICLEPVMKDCKVLVVDGKVQYQVGFKTRDIGLGYWEKDTKCDLVFVKAYIKNKIKSYADSVTHPFEVKNGK